MAAYDTYAAALAPYLTAGRSAPSSSGISSAIQKMIDYNSKMNLGLTDDQIVAGIKAFAERSAAQWGTRTPLDGSSNYGAIAAESIERALTLAGKDGGAFWNNAVKDAYPVTSDGTIPTISGAGWNAGRLRAHDNWNYSTGGNYATTDSLDKALNDWTQGKINPTAIFTGSSNADTVGMATGQEPLYFSDAQRKATAETMRTFNSVLKLGLSEEDMVKGVNQFSGAQYQIYNQGYNAGSDPYNIARWSLWNALNNKGKTDVGNSLIEKTNAKQALTATQAEEIYNKANKWVDDTHASLEEQMEKQKAHGFFGHLKAMAPGVLTIASIFTGLGAFLGPAGGLAAAGAAGGFGEVLGLGADALGSGISAGAGGVTGITAGAGGVTGITGSVAGLSGGTLAAASTGGLLVGSDGLLGSTGNAIGDQVLNSAGQNAITSAATGNDPLKGAVQGAVSGLIGASGVGSSVASGLGATGDAATAITSGVNAALGSGATTAINGGSFSDVLTNAATSGLAQGAGSYVGNSVDSGSAAIDRGLGGATAGGINAALTGGNIGTGILTGGAAGAAGGLATDLGASPAVAGAVQGVTGGLINSALQPDAVVNPPPTTTTTTTPQVSSISFSDVIPNFIDAPRSTEWRGNRLIQAGRI